MCNCPGLRDMFQPHKAAEFASISQIILAKESSIQ